MTIKELREKRLRLVEESKAIVNKAEKENRNLVADEKERYDNIFAEVEELGDRIKRQERQEEAEKELGQATRERAHVDSPEKSTEARAEAQMKAFEAYLMRGMHNLSQQEYRDLTVGTNSEGGYTLAPAQYVAKLLKNVDDLVFIRQKATKYQINGAHKLQLPTLAADPADSDWTSELLVGSEDSTMAFGTFELDPNPLAKYLLVSNTLLNNSQLNIADLVLGRLSYKFAVSEEKGFMTGDGSSKAIGIFEASATGCIPTSRDKAFAATTAVDSNALIDAKYHLKEQYLSRAEWVFHRTTVAAISKLKDSNGQYVWQPGISKGEPDTILGLSVNKSEFCPNTLTAGLYAGALGDFSNYHIADQLQMQFQRLVELKALTNQTVFVGRLEVDGRPAVTEAFVRLKMAAS
jgi:HK97 family phage major capsid protein